jgi:hypothetical protein
MASVSHSRVESFLGVSLDSSVDADQESLKRLCVASCVKSSQLNFVFGLSSLRVRFVLKLI